MQAGIGRGVRQLTGGQTAAGLCDVAGGWIGPGDVAQAPQGFTWMVMPRHGRRPLAFLGREMLRADDGTASCRTGVPVWFDMRIYELPGIRFVVVLRHVQAADGLPRWQDAWCCEDEADVIRSLRAHDVRITPGYQPGQIQAWADLLDRVFGPPCAA